MKRKCKDCQSIFDSYSTLQNRCFECAKKKYKPLNPIGKKAREWMDKRDEWLEEDKNDNGRWYCEVCKCEINHRSEVEYHHIQKRSVSPHLRLKRDNLLRCCHLCHQEFEDQIMWSEQDGI